MKQKKIKRIALIGLLFFMLFGFASYKLNFFSGGTGHPGGPAQPISTIPPSEVAVVQSGKSTAEELKYEDIKSMVTEAVKLSGGLGGIVHDGNTVVIKPNLVSMYDATLPGWKGRLLSKEVNGVTTDWRVTKSVVELVRELNPSGKIYIMEGSAFSTGPIMQYLNYTKEYIPGVDEFIAIEEDSGAWQDYNSPGLIKIDLPNGLLHKSYYLNRKYYTADVLICLPVLKNHYIAAVSGAIKNIGIGASPANIYGNSSKDPGRNGMVDHNGPGDDMHKWLCDFYMCKPISFVITDGLQGVQNGPTPSYDVSGSRDIKKDQMNMRLILAGSDAVAVDTVQSLIVGWDPRYVNYLGYLSQRSYGNLDTAKITVLGNPVSTVRKYFKGVIPMAGGRMISDKTPPALAVKPPRVIENNLKVEAKAASETIKLEVYLDDVLLGVILSDFGNISLDIGKYKGSSHSVRIYAYDRYLNRSEQIFKDISF